MSLTQLTDLQPTNIKVTGIATFDQTVGIAGTLTYEDVTNVDSVGILTARSTIDAQGSINLADSIIHTGDTNTKIRFPAADTITAETGGSERVRISSGGSIGIGTDNPQQDVHILRSQLSRVRIESTSTSYNSDVIFQNPDGLMGVVGYNATLDSINIDSRGGTNGVTFTRTGVEKVRIASNGNVGIGTDNPQKLLEIQHVGNRKLQFSYDDNIITIKGCNNNSNPETIRLIGGNSIRFHTGATGSGDERLRITSSGNVNIGGNYTQTTYKAQIQTGTNKFISFINAAHDDLSNEGSGIIFSRQNDGSKELSGIFGHSNSSLGIAARTDLTFHAGGTSNYGSAPERLRITSAGDMGLGVTDATILNDSGFRELTIGGLAEGAAIHLQDVDGNVKFGIFTSDVTAAAIIRTITNHPLHFRTNNTERVRIESDGNVVFTDKDSGHTGGGFYSRTKSVTGGTTANFMRFSLTHGALAGAIYLTCSNNSYSISKSYTFAVQFGDGSNVNLQSDSGPMGGVDFIVSCSTSASTHTFRVQNVGGATVEVNLTVVVGCANQDITYTEL